jgi:D-alanyl-lipoteichoic acid acyltransferase DltB (MBOAT superfamily)
MSFVPIYILILLLTIVIDYTAGILIEKQNLAKFKKIFLITSIISNIGILVFFKYTNFLIQNLNGLANFLNWNYSLGLLSIILPIGLSFHTFQSLSYIIEVYRGKQFAEKNLGIFALYVLFYPQLVAGPIERPQNMLHQFREKHNFNYDDAVEGLKLMAWGFLKKIVVADRAGEFVNLVYGNVKEFHGWPFVIATIFFAFQIYYDFSGYSDIARGAAKIMGFKLMLNFDNPYQSLSISEFWNRWHISLSSWFRDYVYIPLGGNRVGKIRNAINVMIVFLLSGLWHGANWTYVVWGGLNGAYILLEKSLKNNMYASNIINKIPQYFLIIFNFIIVSFAWIFFRSKSIHDAIYIISNLFNKKMIQGLTNYTYIKSEIFIGRGLFNFIILTSFIILIEYISFITRSNGIEHGTERLSKRTRWLIYYLALLLIICFGIFGNNSFIYFQF